MKLLPLSWLLVHMSLLSCSQTKQVIRNAYGFEAVRTAGTIAVDEAGRQLTPFRDTVILVYVEASAADIKWGLAWKGDKSYAVVAEPAPAEVVAGKRKTDGTEVQLSPARGHTLWRLEFSPTPEPVAAPEKLEEGELLLQGEWRGKKVVRRIRNLTELQLPDAV